MFKQSAYCMVLAVCLLSLASQVCAAPASTASVKSVENWLVKDGVARGAIEVPLNMSHPIVLASQELQTYLKLISGAQVVLSYRPLDPRDVGIRLVVRDPSLWQGKESAQTFYIKSNGRQVTIEGNTGTAVLYGSYQYLSDLGVRWYTPGEIGQNVPTLKSIPILEKGVVRQEPSFLGRVLDLSGGPGTHFDYSDPNHFKQVDLEAYSRWLLRNRVMFSRFITRGNHYDFGRSLPAAEHSIARMVLHDTTLAKEPERYPLVTRHGKQERRDKGVQICFTHPKNIDSAVQSVLDYFAKLDAQANDPKIQRNTDLDEVSDTCPIGLEDTTGICECDNCMEVAGDGPLAKDRLVWTYLNEVARRIAAQRPGAKIGLFAPYFELSRPPAGLAIESNIVATSCRYDSWSSKAVDLPTTPFSKEYLDNLTATRDAGAQLRAYDYVLWRGTPQPSTILDAIKTYSGLQYRHYMAEVMSRHEQSWPVLWSAAQLLWDVNQEPKEVMAEFCNGYYGQHGPMILNILNTIDINSRRTNRLAYGSIHNTSVMMSPELIKQGRAGLANAIASSQGVLKERLVRFNHTFEMHSQMAEFYDVYCTALNTRDPQAIAETAELLAKFKQYWQDNDLSRTNTPGVLALMTRIANKPVAPRSQPQADKLYEDKSEWLTQLFAGSTPPEKLNDLTPLPEVWQFRVDQHNIGVQEKWFAADYQTDRHWQPISTWNFFEAQGYDHIDGWFWYQTRFDCPTFPKGKKVMLRIGALDDAGDIYLNGQLVRKSNHINMWDQSFATDVTQYIKQGQSNVLTVHGYDSVGAGGIWKPSALYSE